MVVERLVRVARVWHSGLRLEAPGTWAAGDVPGLLRYMLQPMIQVLRKKGIPFHNPYRKANGLWNPLLVGRRTSSRTVLALLQAHPQYGEGTHEWTGGT